MAVYKQGVASVEQGSATVTGSGTAWQSNASVGDVFTVVGSPAFTIGGIVSDTELTLTAPFGGSTASDVAYSITRDFTSGGKPLLAPGSTSVSGVYNANLQGMEDLLGDLSGVTDAEAARGNLGLGNAALATVQTSPTDTTPDRLMPNKPTMTNRVKISLCWNRVIAR